MANKIKYIELSDGPFIRICRDGSKISFTLDSCNCEMTVKETKEMINILKAAALDSL